MRLMYVETIQAINLKHVVAKAEARTQPTFDHRAGAIGEDNMVGWSLLRIKTPIEHAFAIEVQSLGTAGSGRQERQGQLRHLVP
jgi:hypothetical protein